MCLSQIRYCILFFLLALSWKATGQIKDVGVPDIKHFSKQDYQGSTQNWQIESNANNWMYFANNDGLLEFDGSHWQLYSLPNQSIIRSVKIDEGGRIYVGQQNDFGFMEPDLKGELKYHSLVDLVSEDDRNFEEIWRIHLTDFGVVFQSYTHLFVYRDNRISTVHLPNRLRFSFYINDRLWIQDEEEGLKEYRRGKLYDLPGVEELKEMEVWTILPIYANRVLIGTANHGVFIYDGETLEPWEGAGNQFLKDNQIFSAAKFQDAYYAFGTIQDGLLITDERGKIIQHVNKKKGLQNNTILSIGVDGDNNLWLGLDNGIDYVNISSPFTFMYDPEGLGATYSSLVHRGKLYVGTNHGLFVKDWPEGIHLDTEGFRLIPKTVGQVWYLGVHQGAVLCGHDNGAYLIQDERATQISDIRGAWMFLDFAGQENYLIGGNYNGLTLFRKTEGEQPWELVGPIKGFTESSKLLAEDEDGSIWMSHGFKGVFRIQLNTTLDSVVHYDFYNSNDGLPSDIYVNLMTVGRDIIYTSPNGIYAYNPDLNRFEPSVYYNNIFEGQTDIDYIKEDQFNNIWFVGGSVPGVLRFQEDGTFNKVAGPFESLAGRIISGFQNIHVVDRDNTLISLEDGLAHYTPSYKVHQDEPIGVFLREVENLTTGKTVFPALRSEHFPEDSLAFEYRGNNLRFTFSSPEYKSLDKLKFSYRLVGYSESWSEWSESSVCVFMNLYEGDYTFEVKAIDPFDMESEISRFHFYIHPPWFRSTLAILFYVVSALLLLALISWLVYRRMQISKRKERLKNLQEHRRQVQQYQREMLVSEKEIIRLRNEKLRGKMIHLDKELANQTMSLVQKNKFMDRLKKELKNLQSQTEDSSMKSKISLIINRIDKEFDDKRQKELFETYFDEVHEDFFKRLTERYPNLTPREQKLCAYIKMNISTKEIATLQNISTRGIEIGRYRLRKKLGLDRDTNLSTFISSI